MSVFSKCFQLPKKTLLQSLTLFENGKAPVVFFYWEMFGLSFNVFFFFLAVIQ